MSKATFQVTLGVLSLKLGSDDANVWFQSFK